MSSWNVPLNIIKIIRNILTHENLLTSYTSIYDSGIESLSKATPSTFNYDSWIETLSNATLKVDSYNDQLLDEALNLINDPKLDYHILSLEGLLKIGDNEIITIEDKYKSFIGTNILDEARLKYEKVNNKKNLFLECIKNTSHSQIDNYLVLKYNSSVSYLDLWNDFYLETRGVVIDLSNMELVSVAYPKFFNFNEKYITQYDNVAKKMNKANRVFIRNKEDGSMISCTVYKNELITSTPGSLSSDQALWAKEYLRMNNPQFIKQMNNNYSYIFEAIYPNNRIVLDYGNVETLILTGIRNIENGKMLSQEEVNSIASQFNFTTPNIETKTLDEIIRDSKDNFMYPGIEKEGWVVICESETDYFMFKIKCDEYCELHRLISNALNVKVLLGLLQDDMFDDYIAKIPSSLHKNIILLVERIFSYIKNKEENIDNNYRTIPKDMLFTYEEVKNYEKFKKQVDYVFDKYKDTKLATSMLSDVYNLLLAKGFGKNISTDKWTMKELDRLWAYIPNELKDNKVYNQKNGKIMGFINKNFSSSFTTPYILNKLKFIKYDLLRDLSHKELKHLETIS